MARALRCSGGRQIGFEIDCKIGVELSRAVPACKSAVGDCNRYTQRIASDPQIAFEAGKSIAALAMSCQCIVSHFGCDASAQVTFRSIRSDCFRRAIRASDMFGTETAAHAAPAAADTDAIGGWDVAEEMRRIERRDCLEACADADMIVFNLFALIGFHIAEALYVRVRVC